MLYGEKKIFEIIYHLQIDENNVDAIKFAILWSLLKVNDSRRLKYLNIYVDT